MKIAMIGAGSLVFCKTLLLDVLAVPELGHVTFSLMAPSTRHTEQVKRFADRVIRANGLDADTVVTTSRQEALDGADFVVCTLKIGGADAHQADIAIPLRYGVSQCIGDTLAPGGIMRTLRTAPVMRQVAEDMRRLCPNALMLNYVNPMATVCWAMADVGIRSVGLCHGVQTTLDLIAGYCGVPKGEIDYTCAGINHMGWFLTLRHGGQDLYPLLRQRFEQPEYYANEKVRGETLRQFGYFMTESSGHLSEYLPYYRKNELGMDLYCREKDFGGETGAALKWSQRTRHALDTRDIFAGEPDTVPPRSAEYGGRIIEAVARNLPFRFNGNLRNNGAISNLPEDCIAETAVFADGSGLHQTRVGALPSQLAALNLMNISAQRLAVEAALEGDPEKAVWAMALDPLTAACLTPGEIREMTTELLQAEAALLPQFGGRLPRPTPVIHIPADTVRAEVPVDPALRISARIAQL